jgi:predicted amidohydrolase YtcJ
VLRAEVPQNLLLLGDSVGSGPYKLVLTDHDLPSYDELLSALSAVRPRPVAVHCVTREALVLLLAALDKLGHMHGDRIEHGSVVPGELARMQPAVVTQPAFLTVRGDDYLRSVDAADLPDLYRYQSLVGAGTCVVPSSDAPFGPLDPWPSFARQRTGPPAAEHSWVSTRP